MGKRYFCDYCDKTMVSAPSIVKTHNKGIIHQKNVQMHYQQHKDPETILAEEEKKKPCTRFLSGVCNFGPICIYSHYTREELNALRDTVMKKRNQLTQAYPLSFEDIFKKLQEERYAEGTNNSASTTIHYDSNGVTHVFPWIYNPVLDSFGDNLPPSVKRMKIEDFEKSNLTEWG